MADVILSADCGRCADLCCIALAFDRSALFAVDKAAGEPCSNLDASGGCSIHERREQLGFGGCVRYDCLGAGQRVVQELFDGRSWRDDPSLLEPMIRAYALVQELHRDLALLDEAARLPLAPEERRELAEIQGELHILAGLARSPPALSSAKSRVGGFLRSLEPHVRARKNRI